MKKLNFRYQFKSGKIDPEEKENQPQKFWYQPQRWRRNSRVISTTHVSPSVWPDIFSDSGTQKDQEEIRQVLNLEEKKKNSQLTLRIYSQRPLKKKSKHQNKTSLVTLKLLYFFGYLWLITSEVPPQLIRLGTRTIEWQLLLNSEPKETQIRLHVEAQSQTHTGRLTDIVITESSGLSQVSELLWIEGHSRDFTDEEPSLN